MARGATATPAKPRVRWTAGNSAGIAHAHRPGRVLRTVCGLPAIDEQFAWPARQRCVPCETALGIEAES